MFGGRGSMLYYITSLLVNFLPCEYVLLWLYKKTKKEGLISN